MMRFKTALALIFVSVSMGGLSGSAFAQDPNFTLRFAAGVGGPLGGTATTTTILDFPAAPINLAGWSFGVCHDVNAFNPIDAVLGTTSQTIDGGSPPAFVQINVIRNGEEEMGFTPGVNIGLVISFLGLNPLTPGSNYELLDVSYDLIGPEGPATLEYCGTTQGAADPVDVVLTEEGGAGSTVPVQIVGSIDIGGFVPPVLRVASDLTIDAAADVSVTLDHETSDVYGFSFGLVHDNDVVNLTGIVEGAATANADFFGVDIDPADPGVGGTVGCVLSLSGGVTAFIPATTDSEVAVFQYAAAAGAVADDTSALTFTDTLSAAPGAPPVLLQISTGVEGLTPDTTDGLITVTGATGGGGFRRGDTNNDGGLDVADAVFLLNFLFVPASDLPACDSATDVNDDGMADVADSVFLLNFLFVPASAAIPEPVDCGADPTADTLTCAASSCP